MEDDIQKFKIEFPTFKIEVKDIQFTYQDEEVNERFYYIRGLDGNKELPLTFRNAEELTTLSEILKRDIFIFKDFLAIKYEDIIEILLTPVSSRSNLRRYDDDEKENFKLFEISFNYFKNELDISIEFGNDGKLLPAFAFFIKGGKRYSRRPIILKIQNFSKTSVDGLENDCRNIINSVLFDLEYNYDIVLETVNIESLTRRYFGRKRSFTDLPKEKISLVYKKYIPELIQYFHIAEKVDFLPFKFICYYHIIEYFSDKSAYHLVSNEVKKILLKPDFHTRTDHYVNNAINIFKKENEKYTGDKIKIERVLKQYINREEFKSIISELEMLDYFSKENIIDCVKPLKLPAVNFEQDGNFYSELTKRIYSMRCSIVHSNPDFDENKAVPFNPTPANLDKLRLEIELIMEIARLIIVESKE